MDNFALPQSKGQTGENNNLMSTRGGFVIEEVSISWMECDCGESDDECNWVTESRSSGPHFRG